MNAFKELRIVGIFAALLLLTCIAGIAQAQTQPWDTNVISWVAPTQCSTGEPVSACPVTGYRLEQSPTATGAYTTVATVAATASTYSHTGVTAGQHCYRAFSNSANGDSSASNVVCKTNVKPVGPPNPPVLTIAAVAFSGPAIPLDSLDGFNRTPVFSITASGPGVLMGFCKVATPSVADAVTTYRGQTYCKPLLNHPRTGVANIAWLKGVTATQEVIAPCA